MEVPPNETPDLVVSVFDKIIGIFSSYGWTILFFAVVLNLLWSHFYPKYKQWKDRQDDQQRMEEYSKNPEKLLAREEALQRSRQKLQEKYDELAREHAEKMRIAEERKRQEKIERYEQLMQGKSKIKPSNSSSLRGEYNALSGSGGGSCSFRPTRRGGGGGGGG